MAADTVMLLLTPPVTGTAELTLQLSAIQDVKLSSPTAAVAVDVLCRLSAEADVADDTQQVGLAPQPFTSVTSRMVL